MAVVEPRRAQPVAVAAAFFLATAGLLEWRELSPPAPEPVSAALLRLLVVPLYGALAAVALALADLVLIGIFAVEIHMAALIPSPPCDLAPHGPAVGQLRLGRGPGRDPHPVADRGEIPAARLAGGHLAGDRVLRTVAAQLAATCRRLDLVARYGGEEFVLSLPETDRVGAAILGEALRAAVAAARTELPGQEPVAVTISVGMSVVGPGVASTAAAAVLECADQCLYRAKRGGKNRVELAS